MASGMAVPRAKMGHAAEASDYSAFLELQLERMTTAALNASTFQERIVQLERRLASTDDNVLGAIRLARTVEAAIEGRERTAENQSNVLARELHEALALTKAQRDSLAHIERELSRVKSEGENMAARMAEQSDRAAAAERRLAEERAARERTVHSLERQMGALGEALDKRLEVLERERGATSGSAAPRRTSSASAAEAGRLGAREAAEAAARAEEKAAAAEERAAAAEERAAAAEQRAAIVEGAMAAMERRIVGIVAGGVRQAKDASADAVASLKRAAEAHRGGERKDTAPAGSSGHVGAGAEPAGAACAAGARGKGAAAAEGELAVPTLADSSGGKGDGEDSAAGGVGEGSGSIAVVELRVDALERALAQAELRLDERIRASAAVHAQRLSVLARALSAGLAAGTTAATGSAAADDDEGFGDRARASGSGQGDERGAALQARPARGALRSGSPPAQPARPIRRMPATAQHLAAERTAPAGFAAAAAPHGATERVRAATARGRLPSGPMTRAGTAAARPASARARMPPAGSGERLSGPSPSAPPLPFSLRPRSAPLRTVRSTSARADAPARAAALPTARASAARARPSATQRPLSARLPLPPAAPLPPHPQHSPPLSASRARSSPSASPRIRPSPATRAAAASAELRSLLDELHGLRH